MDPDAQARRIARELTEITEMLEDVRANVAANGRGWVWNLMHELDGDGADVEDRERRLRPAMRARCTDPLSRALVEIFPPADGTAAAPASKAERDHSARGKRLAAAMRAYQAALPDLEWAASQWRGASNAAIEPDFRRCIEQGRAAIHAAIEEHDRVTEALKRINSIHGRVRGAEHVKVAAMALLGELLNLDGAAKIAGAIEQAHADGTGPCPRFAVVASDEHIRAMWSRCGLTSTAGRRRP